MMAGLGRGYVLRARTQPALLVALPFIAFLLYVFNDAKTALAVPILSTLGVVALSNEIVRGRGKRLESRLMKEWGGLPTTAGLRWSGGPAAARHRRDLEKMTQLTLATQEEETRDPEAADREYAEAVRVAITRIGRDTLLQSEAIGYGLRRNLRAWKTVELWLIPIAVVANAVLGWSLQFPLATFGVWAVHLAALIEWLVFVTDSWVREQADVYADQFFTEVASAIPPKESV